MASDPDLFSKKEVSQLFGKKFLRNLVREVDDDNKMKRKLGCPGSCDSVVLLVERCFKMNNSRGGFTFNNGYFPAKSLDDLKPD